jgi:hypothetical protein
MTGDITAIMNDCLYISSRCYINPVFTYSVLASSGYINYISFCFGFRDSFYV